jgi:2'-5' RNA ligase
MDKTISVTGHSLYEYQVVIDIPAALRKRIETDRQQITENYGIVQPPAGRPHISLVRFMAVKKMENKITLQLQQVAMAAKPFTVVLRDYDGYPMHAVFIQINNQQKVLDLIKKLKPARRLMKAGGDEPHFLLDPQMVLAGRLENDTYIRIMKDYQHKKFAADLAADAFLLLRRNDDEKRYEVVKRFEFAFVPEKETQGVLF